MKFFTIIFLFTFSFPFLAQQKTKTNDPTTNLFSEWNYLSGSGGITGKGPGWTNENQVQIKFKKKGCYTFSELGKTKTHDKFKTNKRKSIFSEQEVWLIDYRNNLDQVFEIRGDSLFLQDEAMDGFSYVFLKKK